MLILIMLLVIGLFAGFWGFIMCFLPARWDRLTGAMTFVGSWTEPSLKRPNQFVRLINRIAGLGIFAVGCWFAYMAALEIDHVLSGRATGHTAQSYKGALAVSSAPGVTALSVLVIVVGILMAAFPTKAVAVFEKIWPPGRSVTSAAAPKIILFVRLSGAFFAVLALMSLVR